MISYSNNYLIPHFDFYWQSSSNENNCLVYISTPMKSAELETQGHNLDIHISNIEYNYKFYLLVLESFGRIHIWKPQGPRRHFEVGGTNTCAKFWIFPLPYSFCHWISSVDSDRLDDSDKKDNSNSPRVVNNSELKGAPNLAKKRTKRCTIFFSQKEPYFW